MTRREQVKKFLRGKAERGFEVAEAVIIGFAESFLSVFDFLERHTGEITAGFAVFLAGIAILIGGSFGFKLSLVAVFIALDNILGRPVLGWLKWQYMRMVYDPRRLLMVVVALTMLELGYFLGTGEFLVMQIYPEPFREAFREVLGLP